MIILKVNSVGLPGRPLRVFTLFHSIYHYCIFRLGIKLPEPLMLTFYKQSLYHTHTLYGPFKSDFVSKPVSIFGTLEWLLVNCLKETALLANEK